MKDFVLRQIMFSLETNGSMYHSITREDQIITLIIFKTRSQ